MTRFIFFVALVSIIIVSGGFFYSQRSQVRDWIFEYQKASLPEATKYTNTHDREYLYKNFDTDINTDTDIGIEVEIPEALNLAVPFTSQAPHANWDLPYKETCEEASLLMVARYKKGEVITSPEDADREILKLVEFQNNYFGDPAERGQSPAELSYYKDTTAEQTAEIAREYYGFKNTEVIYDFTIEDIKKELALGNPIIVPAAGRQLGNPYFRRPGPLYHMLVIRGYTQGKFITNDPGTKRGEEFVYKYNDLLNAVHDWNGGEVDTGQKVMIVVR